MTLSTSEIWIEFGSNLKGFILKRVKSVHDAEDILQDVFFKIHNNLNKLEENDKLQSWIYKIARNTIIDYYRHQKGQLETGDIPVQIPEETDQNVGGYYIKLGACLPPMLENLPDKYREAITLTHLNGLTQREMAEQLGLSLSGAKSRVQRARDRLRSMFLECCEFEFDGLGHIIEYQHKNCDCCYCAEK